MDKLIDTADSSRVVGIVKRNSVSVAITLVMLILVVLIFLQVTGLYMVVKKRNSEHLDSAGVNTGVILDKGNRQDASKALTTLRYSAGFSGANQGAENNATWTTNQMDQPWCDQNCQMENLVNGRGEPDFWEISGELGRYRRGTAGRKFKGGNYWSPDLQSWLSADEVAALTPKERANVQFYGDLSNAAAKLNPGGAIAGVTAGSNAAAAARHGAEHAVNPGFSEVWSTGEHMALNQAYQNTPEASMMRENLATESQLTNVGELY